MKFEDGELFPNECPDSANQRYTKSQKRYILWAALLALFLANMMMLNMAVLLPKYIQDRNENNEWTYRPGTDQESSEIDSKEISFIISSFFVACILNAPFNS